MPASLQVLEKYFKHFPSPFLWKGRASAARRGWLHVCEMTAFHANLLPKEGGKNREQALPYVCSAALRSFDSVLILQISHFLGKH